MALRKIHLNLLEITGQEPLNLQEDAISSLAAIIQKLPVQGIEPNRYAIVGTRSIGSAIGGFFAVEYQREVLGIDDNKQERRSYQAEWEKTVFVIFPTIGTILLQSRQYPKGLPEDRVDALFRQIMNEAFQQLGYGGVLIRSLGQREVPDSVFIEAFDNPNNRIEKMVVRNLRPDNVLESIIYYNPKIERNRILGQAFKSDFSRLDNIELDAGDKGDNLRQVFMAKAAVRSGENEEMRLTESSGEKRVIHRTIREKYEISVDADAEEIAEEDLQRLASPVLEQFGVPRTPVRRRRELQGNAEQLPLF